MSKQYPSSHPEEFLSPTRTGRVVVVALVLVLALIQWGVLPFVVEWMEEHNAVDPAGAPFRKALVVAVGIAGATSMGVVASLWHWLMAYRVYRSSIFPPRGYPILARTAVLRGPAAVRKAHGLLVVGIVCAAMTMATLDFFFRIMPGGEKLAVLFR